MAVLQIDPTPRWELSPHLYMQFMEPLGTTDGSVEAGWDFARDSWREELIKATRDLGPTLLRWPGGIVSSFYRWREAVGPPERRIPMVNYCWGGVETNRVGTHEFVNFCRRTDADPLIAVNFGADGRPQYIETPRGERRAAGPEEAAAWVRYCNDPDDAERTSHGAPEPFGVRLWQLGNETSYDPNGFTPERSARTFLEFAEAMRAADPGITLIGWGDRGKLRDGSRAWWAKELVKIAAEHVDMIAMHRMNLSPADRATTVLKGLEYLRRPDQAWDELMAFAERDEKELAEFEQVLDDLGTDAGIAVTESHFSFSPHNACPILGEWQAGVAYARLMNVRERHGKRVRISTLADFCGTRWTVNAIMISVPRGTCYLMPVAAIMRLYRHHTGTHALTVGQTPQDLDVTASRKGSMVYLHVVNANRTRAADADLQIDGATIARARVFEIARDPSAAADGDNPRAFEPAAKVLPLAADRSAPTWAFPAASVSAVELDIR